MTEEIFLLKGDGDVSTNMKEEIRGAVTTVTSATSTTTMTNATYDMSKDNKSLPSASLPNKDPAVTSNSTTATTPAAAAKSVVLDLHANPEVRGEKRRREERREEERRGEKIIEEKRRGEERRGGK